MKLPNTYSKFDIEENINWKYNLKKKINVVSKVYFVLKYHYKLVNICLKDKIPFYTIVTIINLYEPEYYG